jgi:hypothetical protein
VVPLEATSVSEAALADERQKKAILRSAVFGEARRQKEIRNGRDARLWWLGEQDDAALTGVHVDPPSTRDFIFGHDGDIVAPEADEERF